MRGNYDEVVTGMRITSGADYTTEREERSIWTRRRWTRENLTPESRRYLTELPRSARLHVSASGRTAFKASKDDEKISEYRKGFILGSTVRRFGINVRTSADQGPARIARARQPPRHR